MKRLICALALLAGCGGGTDGPTGPTGEPLVGDYNSPIDGYKCSRILSLHANGTFGSGVGCLLNGGDTAAESHRGTWHASDTKLTLTQTRSSCPGETRSTYEVPYIRNMYNLTLLADDAAVVFEETPPGPAGGGTILIGCFTDELAFTQSPEHDL